MKRPARSAAAPDKASAAVADATAKPRPTGQYMRGEHSPFFFAWNPSLRQNRDDVLEGYMRAAARTIDAMHNSGWIAGGVDQACASIMGNGLRIAATPDAARLGWTQDKADEWAEIVESRFEAWAKSPVESDAGARNSLHQNIRAGLMTYYSHGEILALLPRIRKRRAETVGKVKILSPHLLLQDTNEVENLYQGVRCDAWGAPLSYKLDLSNGVKLPENVMAHDANDRQQVIHVFDGTVSTTRGITPMAPALRVVRQFDQLADATLTAALVQAIFAATIKSNAPTADILRALQDDDEQGIGNGSMSDLLTAKGEWYQATKIDLGRSGKVTHLFPGEELEFNGSTTPNDNYEAFAKLLLREVARCLGLTFEELTGDYQHATYSSVRMATSVIWPVVLWRRENIVARVYQAVYEAWLEEEIEQGRIPFEGGVYGFYERGHAACRAEWRGPAKPQADDLKAAKSYETYKRIGIMSDQRICTDLGFDYNDEYRQRSKEKKQRERLDLPETDTLEPDVEADQLIQQGER